MRAVERIASPNHEQRRGTDRPDAIVLHYTGMTSEEGALRWLCDPRSGVSAHYLVFEDGRIVAMVDEERRAWHAGESFWQGATDLNSRSIGIEITNPGHEHGYCSFPDVQIAALIDLLDDIRGRRSIPDARILAHSDIAPHRKQDPGERFPWARLAAAGHGVWPGEGDGEVPSHAGDRSGEIARFLQRLARLGYGIAPTGEPAEDGRLLVAAFQRRYRPRVVTGLLDEETNDVLARLEAALAGVDAVGAPTPA